MMRGDQDSQGDFFFFFFNDWLISSYFWVRSPQSATKMG